MTRKKNIPGCYLCDSPATSREHVPASCFFPRPKDAIGGADLRRNLFTVPSCDEHNTEKSKDDDYLWLVILASVGLNDHGRQMVRTKIVRSIQERPSLSISLMRDAKIAYVSNDGMNWEPTVSPRVRSSRIYGTLEKLGRALYFYHFKRRWLCVVTAFPHFASFPAGDAHAFERNSGYQRLLAIATRGFGNTHRYGDNQEIFFYEIHASEADRSTALMRMTFYGGVVVTIAFSRERIFPGLNADSLQ